MKNIVLLTVIALRLFDQNLQDKAQMKHLYQRLSTHTVLLVE